MSEHDSKTDRAAAEAVVRHHTELAESLDRHTAALLDAVERGTPEQAARIELSTWLREELLPHARAEEQALYPAAAADPRGALLVDGMLTEHRAIASLAVELEQPSSPVRAAAAARAVAVLFAAHLAKENDLILPLLVEAKDVSLARVLQGMHAILGADGDTDTASS